VLLCIERLLCPKVTNIDLGATFPGANMVQGKNTLGYLHTRTFYTPERNYAYKYASFTKCLTYIHLEKCKKKSFNIHSHVRPKCLTKTKMSDQIVGLRECWLSNLSDILGGICRTGEYDRWYTWNVLYIGKSIIARKPIKRCYFWTFEAVDD
jgi:hypothetical protein